MRDAWGCDFNGTASPDDVGAALGHRFAVGREAGARAFPDFASLAGGLAA